MVLDVMGDAETVSDRARIGDIVACAARAFAPGSRTIIVKLERDADHFRAALRRERGDNRTVHASRHRDHDPAFRRGSRQIEQRGGTVRSEREGELVELGHDAGVTLHCREWPEMPPHSAG